MNFYDFTQKELENYLVENGFKKFNAIQIIEWVYEKKIYDFNLMSNLSKKLISFCNENIKFDKMYQKALEIVTTNESKKEE